MNHAAWWRPRQAEEYSPPACYQCRGIARNVCINCGDRYCARTRRRRRDMRGVRAIVAARPVHFVRRRRRVWGNGDVELYSLIDGSNCCKNFILHLTGGGRKLKKVLSFGSAARCRVGSVLAQGRPDFFPGYPINSPRNSPSPRSAPAAQEIGNHRVRIDAEQMIRGGENVLGRHRGVPNLAAKAVRGARRHGRGRCRRRRGPLNRRDQWCRPPPRGRESICGVRPCSLMHRTSVSSSRPRCSRSLMRPE